MNGIRQLIRGVAGAWLVLLGVHCSGGEAGPPLGSASLTVTAADVARVAISVTAAHIAQPITFDLEPAAGQWVGLVDQIPAGPAVSFSAQAFDAAQVLLYEGSASVEITAGQTAAVGLLLQQATPPVPFANSPPLVHSIVVSHHAAAPGQAVALAVSATDADGDALAYAWAASAGGFDDAASSTPVWTAPADLGSHTLSVTVNDGRGGQRTVTFRISVRASAARGAASLVITVNTWPEIAQARATPSRVAAGEPTALVLEASDSDGDALSYQWSDGGGECAGAFDDATLATPTWTAPAAAPTDPACRLTAVVSDGRGGSNTGSVVVFVAPPEDVDFAPEITGTFSSRAVAAPGEIVRFEALAVDPEGLALTFSWAATAGVLAEQEDVGGRSRIAFTTPSLCGESALVTVTVRDPRGTPTSHTFTLAVRMPIEEIDVPDAGNTDADCDGVDGDQEVAVFVRPGGDDAGPGTMAQPFATIAHALAVVAADPVRWQVLVAAGTYPESLTLPDGAGLFGQYDATWARASSNLTIVAAPGPIGVIASDISAATYLEGLEIRTQDAPLHQSCLLYTSPSPRDGLLSRMPSSA